MIDDFVRAPSPAGEVEGYPRGRVPREVRQRQVAELAEALFLERGYQRASMEELARRVGVSKPVIYEIVGSKELLFDSCVARAADQLEALVTQAVAGADGIRDQVRAGGLAFFQFVGARRRVWEVLLLGAAAPSAFRVQEIRERQDRLVAGLILARVAEAGTADQTHVEAMAACVNGAFEGLAGWWQRHPDLTPEQLADWAADLVVPGLEQAAP